LISHFRYCVISQKVAGSFLDEVVGFLNLANPYSHSMALVLTGLVREMCAFNPPGSKGQPACKADKLINISKVIVEKMWQPQYLTTL
jgi:hypothetical protein